MKLGANQERNIAQRRMDIRDATPETIAKYLKPSNPSAGAAVPNAKAAVQGGMHGKMGSRPGSASIFAGGGGSSRPASARGKARIAADSVWPDGPPQELRQQQNAGVLDPAARPMPGPPRDNRRPHGGQDIEFGDEFAALSLRPPAAGARSGGAGGSSFLMGGGPAGPARLQAPPGPMSIPTLSGSGLSSSNTPMGGVAAAASSFMAPPSFQQAFASGRQQPPPMAGSGYGFRPLAAAAGARSGQANAPIFKLG